MLEFRPPQMVPSGRSKKLMCIARRDDTLTNMHWPDIFQMSVNSWLVTYAVQQRAERS